MHKYPKAKTHNTLYVTTPIYYVNAKPHIGHAFTSILSDFICRSHELLGYETFLLTGTDEHGQKVQKAARDRNVSTREHVDENYLHFKKMSQVFNIKYQYFIRTTEEQHKKYVQKILQQLCDQGDIYTQSYKGWYSVHEERFFAKEDLINGKDPIGNKPVEWLEEENYFFRMSKYQKPLLAYLKENQDFLRPRSRYNEIQGFLKQNLKDLCISRSKKRLQWGIELPFDSNFVTYVWFDALLNYQSAVDGKNFANNKDIWPADWHIIGKDILTTHGIYWLTILLATKQELPKHILAHAWWLVNNEKMSKSKGNILDPFDLAQKYDVDAIRYYLIKEMVLEQDSFIGEELIVERLNSDLANDIGNALQRIHKFVLKNFDSQLPHLQNPTKKYNNNKDNLEFIQAIQESVEKAKSHILSVFISEFMNEISKITKLINQYIDKQAPWKIFKQLNTESNLEREEQLAAILYNSSEALRLLLCLLQPVMPTKAPLALAMLGVQSEKEGLSLEWGQLPQGSHFEEGELLFERLDFPPKKISVQKI